ncbi:MAG: alkaline phosphatase family protein, partial [Nitrospirae bacterium]
MVVVDVVGLTPALLRHAPNLSRLAQRGRAVSLVPPLPAVTCTAQATLLTGRPPRDHGIVANGWYFRELNEVWFWRQSRRLVQAPLLWEVARRARPGLTCANLFWWFNMATTANWSVTPRPVYPADGRKIPAIYSDPPELAAYLEAELGPFPFLRFWGPAAGIDSSRWIAAAARLTFDRHRPDLTLVYLPHLDYDLQRLGPEDPAIADQVAAVDRVAGGLADHAEAAGARVVVLSEYGIEAVRRPVAINRTLRRAGWLAVRQTPVGDLLDPGRSRAFAVADHQVAHLYLRDPAEAGALAALLEGEPGIGELLHGEALAAAGLDHPRSGEVVAVAAPGAWFTYDYWLEPERAPDFAPTVDIHRKPGYDPRELFLDPALRFPRLRIARRLLQARLGMRCLMDVVPLDPTLVRGSHGRPPPGPDHRPLLIT